MIVTDTFPPDINGVARTLHTLAGGLAKRGHAVEVITTTAGAATENAATGLRISRVTSFSLPGYRGVRLGIASKHRMASAIRAGRPDALYVAVETPLGMNTIRAARDCGIGVVSGFHTNFHSYTRDYHVPVLRDLLARYLRYVHNRTARTLAPSEGTAAQLRELGVHNVGVMGRGVDTELFNPTRRDEALRRQWGADDATPVALFVGRVAAEKNLPLAVKTFQQLRRDRPACRCVFVGDGPKAAWLREAHPEFIHAGARTGEDLARHYASADLFVFPSLTETFGNVLLEAMASRLVTLSFDYAAALQIVRHGENGFKAVPGDEADFLATAFAALTHWNDARLRDDALATARQLSWDTIISQFESELIAASAQSSAQQPNTSA